MGKGIIFVGSGNLNRNKDQQSMYQYGYRNQRQKDSRTLFYGVHHATVQKRTIG